LSGKLDLIPNRINVIPNFQADEPGVYYGQCAEFCGESHALMKLKVVAQPNEEFEAWVQGMRSVPSPMTGLAQEGGEIFIQRGCSACHSIRGTGAAGAFGPNLTQFGARTTLAAGTLENTRDNLYRWLEDPQAVKPGAQMPNLRLNDHDIIRLVSYLRNLRPDLSQLPPVAGETPTPGAPIPTDPEAGKRLFVNKGCAACHTIQGLPGAVGAIGPELTHVASQQSIVDGKLAPVDVVNLKRWLRDPSAVKPGTLMPKLGLTDDELSALVAYLLTLK
ncbi:MAG: c-type cytochrome, partial [Chloroflexota bacterium]|nr:c-type cytochrome [Chloroflexota bacterium]